MEIIGFTGGKQNLNVLLRQLERQHSHALDESRLV